MESLVHNNLPVGERNRLDAGTGDDVVKVFADPRALHLTNSSRIF